MSSSHLTLKNILLRDANWYHFEQTYRDRIRPSITNNIVKLLSCGQRICGYDTYHCSNHGCTHTKIIAHTCKGRACSSCGRKGTAQWLAKQHDVLPQTSWQHITFTMPGDFWDLFWFNRGLLQLIAPMATRILQDIARKKGLMIGIFLAIHTFGRDLKRNVHLHVSVTTGGITLDSKKWKSIFFPAKTLMQRWRTALIKCFRNRLQKNTLHLPNKISSAYPTLGDQHAWLDYHASKHWQVNCQKPSNNPKQNIEYLGRYIKRPPIANSRLYHYAKGTVSFGYLDHTQRKKRTFTCAPYAFIRRWIQHIPDKHFRMIRYYGFLANCKRGIWLTKVNALLGRANHAAPIILNFATLMAQTFSFNPLTCIICQSPMRLASTCYGVSHAKLMTYHDKLALGQRLSL